METTQIIAHVREQTNGLNPAQALGRTNEELSQELNESNQRNNTLQQQLDYYRNTYGRIETANRHRQVVELYITDRCDSRLCPVPAPENSRVAVVNNFENIFCHQLIDHLNTAKLRIEGRIHDEGGLIAVLRAADIAARPLAFGHNIPVVGPALAVVAGVFGLVREVTEASQRLSILERRVNEFIHANSYELSRKICEPLIDNYYHQIIRLSNHGTPNGVETFVNFFISKAQNYFNQPQVIVWITELFDSDDYALSLERRLLNRIMCFGGAQHHLPTLNDEINQLNNHDPLRSPWRTTQLENGVGVYEKESGLLYIKAGDDAKLYKKYGFRYAWIEEVKRRRLEALPEPTPISPPGERSECKIS
jgi:hypothetical protein